MFQRSISKGLSREWTYLERSVTKLQLHNISSALALASASVEMDEEIKKLSDNMHTISKMVFEAEEMMVSTKREYAKMFLELAEFYTPARMNIEGISKNSKGTWIERKLYAEKGYLLDSMKNKIKHLERTRENWREQLLAYKKLRDIIV